MLKLKDCLKTYTTDQDKAAAPAETVSRVKKLLAERCEGVLDGTRRIDTGRLGIPVFISLYGPKARAITPTHKQMGKGASPDQAEASALMELVERYSFFNFFATPENFVELTWSEAEERFGDDLMPVSEILRSVDEELPEDAARRLLDLLPWRFCQALHVQSGRMRWVPVNWFKLLNEFNGSSAGNTLEESLLQGGCELVERHVCAIVDREKPELPTIAPESADPVLARLLACFSGSGVKVTLKDFSLGFPVPTVAAVAHDPATFPALSEIVFTAGTASSPVKAAIRALTEVAQLAGDFETAARYEPSGLSKPASLDEAAWLMAGPACALDSLPDVEDKNIRAEVMALADGLEALGHPLYTIDTSHPDLRVPTNYNFAPGLRFRERSRQACLGLYIGRRLCEERDNETAVRGLKAIGDVYPGAHFLPFFEGLAALGAGDAAVAFVKFEKALPLQIGDEDTAICAFYAGYSLTQLADFAGAIPFLDQAIALEPGAKEFFNLRGICRFKQVEYDAAAKDFGAALDLDASSAVDMANLGLCHKFMNRPGPAREYLAKALEMDPALDFAREHLKQLGQG
ncbi:YcaO-domain protein [Desulfovibrio sp. X2]|uniref:YcaO-like family protein n=1 Tax=Desulfovibrio sp. X2 TaxID=941449 RepID=UPI000358EDF9|nr:YcaO-like family protein [Desulfovibrio sp. X2]EPR42753.1 YcaO-domain protein [Desulfovibrio sp. X2]